MPNSSDILLRKISHQLCTKGIYQYKSFLPTYIYTSAKAAFMAAAVAATAFSSGISLSA